MLGQIWGGFVFAMEEVLNYFFNLIGSAGLAIIVFTIVVKIVTLPMTISQLRSSQEMQKIQPKVRELQKKYAKDRDKLNQETMKLYREHGINPAMGCLPMLIQLPIFFGVYAALINLSRPLSLASLLGNWAGYASSVVLGLGPMPANIQEGLRTLANEPFLWLGSLGQPDPWHILPILAGVLQVVQMKMMATRDGDRQQSMMNNTMMLVFPVMFLIIGWTLPAGAVLYWVAQSLVGLVQQYFTTGWGGLTAWLPFLPERQQQAGPSRARQKKEASPAGQGAQRQRGWFWRLVDRMSNLREEAARQDGLVEVKEEGVAPSESKTRLPPPPEKRRSRR